MIAMKTIALLFLIVSCSKRNAVPTCKCRMVDRFFVNGYAVDTNRGLVSVITKQNELCRWWYTPKWLRYPAKPFGVYVDDLY